jgi:hypothetical protein
MRPAGPRKVDTMGTMAGKSSPALFELIRDQNMARAKTGAVPARTDEAAAEPMEPSAPRGREHPPLAVEIYGAQAARTPDPAPSEQVEPAMVAVLERPVERVRQSPELLPEPKLTRVRPKWTWGQPLVVSTSNLCIAAAVGFLLLVVVFTVGYRSGFAQGDERATRELARAAAPLTDPLRTGEGLADAGSSRPIAVPQPVSGGVQPSPTTGRIPTPAPQASPQGTGARAYLTPPEQDPRQPGLNYYAIVGQLDRESAQQIAVFLAENGIAALAVDTAPRGSNNPRLYRVYGLQGMTGAELRSPARAEYEQRISQLGVIWRRDHRGRTDFSQTNWERYQP